MMTQEQVRTVAQVYRQFMMSEDKRQWNEIDDYMEMLEYLDADQLHREADALLYQHKKGKPHCGKDHPESECFVPTIIDAVEAITELYKETGELHKNNRYILQCYLACSQAGMILVNP